VRQVGYLQEFNRDARPTKHSIHVSVDCRTKSTTSRQIGYASTAQTFRKDTKKLTPYALRLEEHIKFIKVKIFCSPICYMETQRLKCTKL